MEYDDIYNCRCVLRLQSGRDVLLVQLTQARTYGGLLEGTPKKRMNDRLIEGLLDRARKDPLNTGEPYLIEPERRSFERTEGDMQFVIDQQRDWPEESRRAPEWMPIIECIGIFRSYSPARDKTMDGSVLTIVWHQDDFGIDAKAVERLRLVDWDRLATDCWGD